MSNWNALANLDALWTVLSDPDNKFGKWDPKEFFKTGDLEARRVLGMCKSNEIKISHGKLLDFGCGVGRMTSAFATHFEECVGVDVSEKMVELARKFNAGKTNCKFLASERQELPFADNTFDVVFSVLVLQHLPTKRMILNYILEFVRVANDNGVIVFQLTNELPFRRRIQGRRRLWSLAASLGFSRAWLFKKGLSPIQMNGVSRSRVEGFIRTTPARLKAVERYDPTEGHHHSYYYFLIKKPNHSPRADA